MEPMEPTPEPRESTWQERVEQEYEELSVRVRKQDACAPPLAPVVRLWHETTDAVLWTRAWMKHIEANPSIPTDEGAMIGWFANAIMAGYDAGRDAGERAGLCRAINSEQDCGNP